MVTRSTVRDGSLTEITPCPTCMSLVPCKDTRSPSKYDKNPASCTVRSISRTFQGAASSATAQRGIGFSVAEILDPVNFKGLYGSSEKDDDREPAAAAVEAAGYLVYSAAYILGSTLKISVCCKQL